MIRNRKGFTLIELLVVVLIIAILAAIALPLYLSATRQAEKRAARSNMRAISTAEQANKIKTGSYTPTVNDLTPDLGRDFSVTGANAPGPNGRSYTVTLITTAGTAGCDVNGDSDDGTQGNQAAPVPADSLKVTSSEPKDGCYIPGVSTK